MAKRIYKIVSALMDAAEHPSRDIRETKIARLVRAHSQAQAIRHVAKDYQAMVASQDDLVASLTSGVKVEDAGADTEDKAAPAAADPSSEGGTPD
jgi:hypothetical protein